MPPPARGGETPTFTCAGCGSSFSLARKVLDRYPGWTPRVCRSCRDATGSVAQRGRHGSPGGGGRTEVTGSGSGSAPPRRGGSSPAASRSGGIEENLSVDEVLRRYHGGPRDGVFTDGSAHPNPGRGGWGAVYVSGGELIDRAFGHEERTTNNRMELMALIAGFRLVPPGESTTVYTDSQLCVNTITRWAPGWERRGWRRKAGEIANLDLVQELYELAMNRPELRLEWIKAHDGARWNEYADSLSTAYRRDTI